MKKQQRTNTNRERQTKKTLVSTCKNYISCERPEKNQGRCNPRCCPSYRKKK